MRLMTSNHPTTMTAEPSQLVPALVAKVYEESSPIVRKRLLEHLLKPLSVLSLAAIANGVFANITLGKGWGWSTAHISSEDAQRVKTGDVLALVHHVQQVSVQAIDSLSHLLSSPPVLAGSTATAMLLALLAKQASYRAPWVDNDFDPIG
jgi:hypothetical protein